MEVSSAQLPAFNVQGKGYVVWSGTEYWAYATDKDKPSQAWFLVGTKDLIKAILLIEKLWEEDNQG